MAEDSQHIKKIAAAAYDYDNDPRWADYWSNILIPPHMASRSDVINHFKQKFYQRFIDPDLVVDPMSSTSSQSTRTPSSSSSASATEQARPRNSGSGTGASARTGTGSSTGTSARTGTPASSLRWDRQSIQFSINAWVLVVAVLSMLPLPSRNLANRAYRLSLLGTGLTSAYSLYSLYGKPRAWNLQAVQIWFQSVFATKDFINLLYCLIFASSQTHIKFALIPVLCRSLEHVAKFLRRNLNHSIFYRKYLEEPCLWVESNTTTLCILSSNAEIGLGFLLILSLFSWQRSIILTFMYWQLLKLMYHAPVSAGYHQSSWANLGRTINPLINRYVPFLNTPLAAAQRWWFSSAIIPLPCAAAGVVKMAMQVPLEQQQQQPGVYQEAVSSGSWHSSGSVGPFFAVIAVITVLAALACVLGRVCAGRDLGSESRYDCVGWIERRCRPCVGGDLECGVRVVVEEEVKSKLPESEQKPPESDAKPSENEQPPPPPT